MYRRASRKTRSEVSGLAPQAWRPVGATWVLRTAHMALVIIFRMAILPA